MKKIFTFLILAAAIVAGCHKSNNPASSNNNGNNNNGQYFFTVTFNEIAGPQNLRLDSTVYFVNAGVYNAPQVPPYVKTIISSYPFFTSANTDSIEFYMSVNWPLHTTTYGDTLYGSDSVTLSLISNPHKINGVNFYSGTLNITSYNDTAAAGNFNFSSLARGLAADTLYISGSFYLPHK